MDQNGQQADEDKFKYQEGLRAQQNIPVFQGENIPVFQGTSITEAEVEEEERILERVRRREHVREELAQIEMKRREDARLIRGMERKYEDDDRRYRRQRAIAEFRNSFIIESLSIFQEVFKIVLYIAADALILFLLGLLLFDAVNSSEKIPKSATPKVSRVGNFTLTFSSASLKFPRTSVLSNGVPPSSTTGLHTCC